MQYDIVNLPRLHLAGHKIKTTAFSPEIPQLWSNYGPILSTLPQRSPLDHKYAVCANVAQPQEASESYEQAPADPKAVPLLYTAAVLLDENLFGPDQKAALTLEDGLELIVIPARTYVHFEHHGPISRYAATLHEFYKNIKNSDLKLDHSFDLERYDQRFDPTGASSVIDLFYPLK